MEWIGSAIAVPLLAGDDLMGILAVFKHEENAFIDQNQIMMLEDFASRAAIALKYIELIESNYNFIAYESHSLKNRIQPIESYIKTLMNPDTKIDNMEIYNDIHNEIKRLTNVVNDIIYAATLPKTNRLPIKRDKDIDLRAFFEEVKSALYHFADDRNMKIIIKIIGDVGSVSFDRVKVFDAVVNLVDNAIRYSKGTKIILCGYKSGDYLTISVSDDGVGISKSERKKVFDMFYRVDSSTKKEDGSGIGLGIAKAIAEAHAGKAWLKSKVDNGTKVYMTFNLKPEKDGQ